MAGKRGFGPSPKGYPNGLLLSTGKRAERGIVMLGIALDIVSIVLNLMVIILLLRRRR